MPDLTSLPFGPAVAVFAAAGAVIFVCGTWLTRVADRFADETGLGEAITGAVFLGALTSLSGVVVSITAASQGLAAFAVSNALGGIAAQVVFLVIADLCYRRANLEHAAASLANLVNGLLLLLLVAIVLIATVLPPVSWFAVHPASPLLVGVYLFGLRIAGAAQRDPLWRPVSTKETRPDEPDETSDPGRSRVAQATLLIGLGLVIGLAGFAIAQTGRSIIAATGLRESVVGALLTATVTSTPELVTTMVAVRRGALTLAVGGILGGNTFDVLFIALSDVAYRAGPIYAVVGPENVFLALLGIVMTTVLLLGLLARERYGPANIGFESIALLLLYLAGTVILVRAF